MEINAKNKVLSIQVKHVKESEYQLPYIKENLNGKVYYKILDVCTEKWLSFNSIKELEDYINREQYNLALYGAEEVEVKTYNQFKVRDGGQRLL